MPSRHTSDGRVFRDPYDVALGAVFRERREYLGLSRSGVEKATGGRVKTRDLDDWENGRRGMRLHTVGALCAVYMVPTAVVLGETDIRYRAGLFIHLTAENTVNQRPNPPAGEAA